MLVRNWMQASKKIQQMVDFGMEFSLLSAEDDQVYPFSHCKEFVLDLACSTINNLPLALWGVEHRPEGALKLSTTEIRMLLRDVEDSKFFENINCSLAFINALEHEFGFSQTARGKGVSLSKLEPCENAEKPTVLLTSPIEWMHCPPLLSLLTLAVRCGRAYNNQGVWDYLESLKTTKPKIRTWNFDDNKYMTTCKNTIKELVDTKCKRFYPERIKNWPPYTRSNPSMVIHQNGGIVSLANGSARVICPKWYKNDDDIETTG